MENFAPSLKIFRTKFSTSALYNGRNKNRRQNPVWEFTKTIIPFALVRYEVIITNSRYALVGYFITSYPTRAHGIIVIYPPIFKTARVGKKIWRIINTIASIALGRKYARILVLRHYLFLVAHSFPRATLSENCSPLGKDNVRGQIS